MTKEVLGFTDSGGNEASSSKSRASNSGEGRRQVNPKKKDFQEESDTSSVLKLFS
jgi:hypothetical protein